MAGKIRAPEAAIDLDMFDPEVIERVEQVEQQEAGIQQDVAQTYLRRRKQAYAAVFSPGMRDKGDIDIVLADLMYFCRATKPAFDTRDGIHADTLMKIKEGRREVFQRIKDFSLLDFDALLMMYTEAVTK